MNHDGVLWLYFGEMQIVQVILAGTQIEIACTICLYVCPYCGEYCKITSPTIGSARLRITL